MAGAHGKCPFVVDMDNGNCPGSLCEHDQPADASVEPWGKEGPLDTETMRLHWGGGTQLSEPRTLDPAGGRVPGQGRGPLQLPQASPEQQWLSSPAFAPGWWCYNLGHLKHFRTNPHKWFLLAFTYFLLKPFEAFLQSNGFSSPPPPCLGQMYSNLVRRFLSAQQGFPPVSWQISILFILPLRSLCKKEPFYAKVLLGQTDRLHVAEGSLIAENTSFDFRGLRKLHQPRRGMRKTGSCWNSPLKSPQMMFDVPEPFSLSHTFGIKSTFWKKKLAIF